MCRPEQGATMPESTARPPGPRCTAWLCDVQDIAIKEASCCGSASLRFPQAYRVPEPGKMDIASTAAVQVTSEDPAHPVEHVFDHRRGPGGKPCRATLTALVLKRAEN
jgi:hypothetical protein